MPTIMRKILTYIFIILLSNVFVGQTWSNIGSGLGHNCYDLQKFHSDIYAATRDGVFRWNNSNWSVLPSMMGIQYPLTIVNYNDTLYVGGDFPSWTNSSRVYKYDGTSWIQAGGVFNNSGWSSTKVLCTYNNKLISGGYYSSINSKPVSNIASYDGNQWDTLGKGLNALVVGLCTYNGNLIASGTFNKSGNDSTIRYVAQWNGIKWQPISTSHTFKTGGGRALISFNGQLIIGNVWDTIANVPMKGITAFNGSTFASMGNMLFQSIDYFWIFGNQLFCSARLNGLNINTSDKVVLKWNGIFWQQVGGYFDDVILTLEDHNGELIAGGFFGNCGNVYTPMAARINIAVGLNEYSKEGIFNFYPNPTKNNLTILSASKLKIEISDIFGKVVLLFQTDIGQNIINLEPITSGVYYLKATDSNNTQTSKLIIE